MNTLTNLRVALLADVTLNGTTGTVAKHLSGPNAATGPLAHLEIITPALAETIEAFDEPLRTATLQAILRGIDGLADSTDWGGTNGSKESKRSLG